MVCGYNIDELGDKIYFLTKTERDKIDISIDSQRQAYAQAPLLIYRHLKVNSVEYEEESLYDNQNRYEFSKSLTFEVNGFLPPDRLFNQYSVVIELNDVGKFLVNYDSMFDIESTFNGYTTTVTLTALSNFPLLPMLIETENSQRSLYNTGCGYFVSDWKGARLTITETGLGRMPRTITDFQVENLEIHYINGQIETNLSVVLPITELNTSQYWDYEIEYFPTNLKDVTLKNNRYEIKWNSMLPTYNINGSSVTLTLKQLDNNYPEINVI
jgi:hypothetical protein